MSDILKSILEKSAASLPLVAEIPSGYGPGYMPTAIACGTTEINGRPAVVMQIANSMGVFFVFLPPEVARQIAGHMDGAAHAADSGIVAPPSPANSEHRRHYSMNAEPGTISPNGRGLKQH
jgi:hypothetical protein